MSNDNSLFELRISSLRNAAEISQQWATHTISILDTELTKAIFATRTFYESYEELLPKPRDQLSLYR